MPEPQLVTIPAVELVTVGTWECSTGIHTFTVDDLASAVAAQDDASLRTPIVKLGHVDPRFDGQPAVGRIENLRLSEDRMTLLGDLVGIPAWLAKVVPSAFPSRSIEAGWNVVTCTGTKHSFALTGLALLGVTVPAIETLADIATFYGADVAASAPVQITPFTILSKERPMPAPVRAAVNVDSIRAEFYETQPVGSWAWIRELWAGDGAYIIVDNDEGDLYQIPWTEAAGTVTFGTPVKVQVQYVPATADDDASLVLAGRFRPVAGQPVAASAAPNAPLPGPKGGSDVDLTQLRTSLGLPEDTPDEDVITAATAKVTAPPPPPPADPPAPAVPELPEGVTVIDQSTLDGLKVAASQGAQAMKTLRTQARDRALDGAVKAGKFAPARREHFARLWDADEEGTAALIASLAANTVPVIETGHDGPADADAAFDKDFADLFPEFAAPKGA